MQTALFGALLIGLVFFVLYRQGILSKNATRAAAFTGSIWGKGSCQARFTACTGYRKRVIHFPESKAYAFALDAELLAGELSVQILDSQNEPLITLTPQSPKGSLAADAHKRYTIVFTFQAATGRYRLKWK